MKKLNQSGAVAMISVVIFSIIITILVSAYARTVINQQRQAINYDLSTRAYYAAESGVQDVIRELKKKDPSGQPVGVAKDGQENCKGGSGYLGDNNSGQIGDDSELIITCQLVDLTPNGIRDVTSEDESRLWQLKADNVSKIDVRWNSKESNENYSLPGDDGGRLFPQTTTWSSAAYPPVIRVNFIRKVGSNYSQAVYFVKPSSTAGSSVSISFSQQLDSKVQVAGCQNNSGYSCSISFDAASLRSDISQGNIYVVIDGVYGEANYEVTPLNSANNPVGVANIADIDVTARTGSVSRRVKQQVNLGGSDTYKTGWFNAGALVVGDGICKLFTVGTAAAQYNNRCE